MSDLKSLLCRQLPHTHTYSTSLLHLYMSCIDAVPKEAKNSSKYFDVITGLNNKTFQSVKFLQECSAVWDWLWKLHWLSNSHWGWIPTAGTYLIFVANMRIVLPVFFIIAVWTAQTVALFVCLFDVVLNPVLLRCFIKVTSVWTVLSNFN